MSIKEVYERYECFLRMRGITEINDKNYRHISRSFKCGTLFKPCPDRKQSINVWLDGKRNSEVNRVIYADTILAYRNKVNKLMESKGDLIEAGYNLIKDKVKTLVEKEFKGVIIPKQIKAQVKARKCYTDLFRLYLPHQRSKV